MTDLQVQKDSRAKVWCGWAIRKESKAGVLVGRQGLTVGGQNLGSKRGCLGGHLAEYAQDLKAHGKPKGRRHMIPGGVKGAGVGQAGSQFVLPISFPEPSSS